MDIGATILTIYSSFMNINSSNSEYIKMVGYNSIISSTHDFIIGIILPIILYLFKLLVIWSRLTT